MLPFYFYFYSSRFLLSIEKKKLSGVPQKPILDPKEKTTQIQISALIQTTYCSCLKFIIAFERRMRILTHSFNLYTSEMKKRF